jgi:cytochrome c-type biogenesis protein
VELNLVTLGLAFGAGLLSFLSPCCVPLVPAYLGYMTGMSVEELRQAQPERRMRVAALALAFVVGLALVFTLLGASASAAGELLLDFRPLILKIAGVLIVLFGLHLLGVFRLPLLWAERRVEFAAFGTGGLGGAFLMGAAFALGWTPCIGPVLASILALASQSQSVYQGMALLFVYALGLGLPFVAAGLALARWKSLLDAFKRHGQAISSASGVVLVAMGALLFSGRLALISAWATSTFGLGLAR